MLLLVLLVAITIPIVLLEPFAVVLVAAIDMRLISSQEIAESRTKCKGCRNHIAFGDIDIQIDDIQDRYINCPQCNHKNILHYHNDDPRNVIDEYKHLPTDEIKRLVKEKTLPYALLFDHLLHDLNMSGIFRSANAFGAREVYYCGQKRYDKRASLGCYNYQDIYYLPTIEDVKNLKSKYKFVMVDNVKGAKEIKNYIYPTNPLVCFGSEADGIRKEIMDLADDIIYIKMFGSIRSLNVSVAAGIVLHDYVRKYKPK